MAKYRERLLMSVLLFSIVLSAYFYSGVKGSPDSVWSVYIALSLIREGNVDLDEYAQVIPMNDYRTEVIDGHIYQFFPIGTPLLAVPLVWVIDHFSQPLLQLDDLYEAARLPNQTHLTWPIERFIASVFVALTAVLLYHLLRSFVDLKRALLLVFIFAFCTTAWSVASRGLWQHGPSMLMLTLSFLLIVQARRKPALIQFAGLPLAYAYIIRPTNALSIALFSLFILVEHRRYVWRYCLGGLLIAGPFFLFNLLTYHSILPRYYYGATQVLGDVQQHYGQIDNFIEAFFGHVISPGRGLFIFSPVLLLSVLGLAWKFNRGRTEAIDPYLALIMLLHWIAISFFPYWWGGATFGPRYFTDIMPYFIYFLIPIVAVRPQPVTLQEVTYFSGVSMLVLISFFIHYRGANQQVTFGWNDHPYRLEERQARLWNWQDLQFLRGLFAPPQPLAVTPNEIRITTPAGDTSERRYRLALYNTGNQPYIWEAAGPTWVSFDRVIDTIVDRHYLHSKISVPDYPPGLYQLGGIYVALRSENGRPVEDGSVVIPVSLEVVESKIIFPFPTRLKMNRRDPTRAGMAAVLDRWQPAQVKPPLDIALGPALAPEGVTATYGPGWYDLERQEDFTWRWAVSPATLLVYSPVSRQIQLTGVPVTLHDPATAGGLGRQGSMLISVNDEPPQRLGVAVEQPFITGLALRPGWNPISFRLQAGNFRPIDFDPATGDARALSFSLTKIRILAK